ncbi:branched-chain amino acid ABC transporter substrate-binding protein [Pseudomonas idahonensis]|uniref:branched-chain amino acid ABC transporter substrate-binding protein n=1 Tax=Pseudomonas idahonensis TaxID=2942628 RepID=UPI0030CDCCFE
MTMKSMAGATALVLMLSSSLAAYADQEIRIGVAGPFTGSYSRLGAQVWNGTNAAAKQINAAGGINGKLIVLVKGDDACEPKQAVAVANRMIDTDHVQAVIGHVCSSSTLPASEIYSDANILMMTPASTANTITERGLDTVTRMVGRDSQQGEVAANYLHEQLQAKRIVIVHDKDSYGMGVALAVQQRLGEMGIKPVLFEGLTRGEKDFNALATKIKGLQVDAVFYGGVAVEAGTLVRQIRESGVDAPFVAGDGIASDDFPVAAGGGQFIKGVLMVFGQDARQNSESQMAVAALRKEGFEPLGYTLYAYAALEAIAQTMQATQSHDGAVLGQWLRDNSVKTVAGNKRWDAKGDLATPDFVMYRWDDQGEYSVLR